jgi:hypothetical protein
VVGPLEVVEVVGEVVVLKVVNHCFVAFPAGLVDLGLVKNIGHVLFQIRKCPISLEGTLLGDVFAAFEVFAAFDQGHKSIVAGLHHL